jgi:hypothetical protein
MPEMIATQAGDPPAPALIMRFKEDPLENRVAYGLSPNVYLLFLGNELAQVHVMDVRATIVDVDYDSSKRPWWQFWK